MREKDSELSPVVLTVAGSDSGGGAGIQADLRAFNYFNVFGTTAITAVTAQNPGAVNAIFPLSAEAVKEQITAVRQACIVRAAKTGMLFNSDIINAVADILEEDQSINLTVDPVMVAGSGTKLLKEDAIEEMKKSLLPLADVITPNIPEAEMLTGLKIADKESAVSGASELAEKFNCSVLLKGGHRDVDCAVDVLIDGNAGYLLSSPVLEPRNSHGTGCSMSAAITACLSLGYSVFDAVIYAKAYVYGTLENCCCLGRGIWSPGIPKHLPTQNINYTTLDLENKQ